MSRDTVWHALQTDPDRDDWTGWQPFGNPGNGAFGPAAWQRILEGTIEVVVTGRDGSVWRRWQTETDPTGRSDWSSLGTPGGDGFLGSPALRQNVDGRLEVFIMREDGSAWHCWQRTAGSEGAWSSWHPFDLPHGQAPSPLAVAIDTTNRLEAFVTVVRGGESAMWHRWQTVAGHGWSDWSSLGTPGSGREPGVPVLGQNADGRLELFTVTGDNAVWHRWQQRANDPESWGASWQSLGHQAGGFTDMAVTLDGQGCLTLVATAQNGRDVWLRAQATPGGVWGSWSLVDTVPTPVDSPSLHLKHDGGLEVFLRIPSRGGLYQLSQTQPDGSWTPGRRWPRP